MCVFAYGCWIYALKVNFCLFWLQLRKLTSAGCEIAFKYLCCITKEQGIYRFSERLLTLALGHCHWGIWMQNQCNAKADLVLWTMISAFYIDRIMYFILLKKIKYYYFFSKKSSFFICWLTFQIFVAFLNLIWLKFCL